MARKPSSSAERKSVRLSDPAAREATSKLERRLRELKALDINDVARQNDGNDLDALSQKMNSTLREIYGDDSLEYYELSVDTFRPNFSFYVSGMDSSIRGNIDVVRGKISRAITALETQIEILKEQIDSSSETPVIKALRAYDGLELHREIARASSRLYRDGHYANAVEQAVKALNGIVRLRSGLEMDGSRLMEAAFGGKAPAIRFNGLADQSDLDEQRGFMMLFSGAVAGLRNPRAHGFIEDDPERALEFIAFVSLLAKILDEAPEDQ